jgi:lipopolysaccharide/colanic/teichoic acid biosynthesis glycosyltransferase
MASVYEQVTGRIPVRHLGSLWWAMLPKPSTDLVYHGIKRLLDIGLALIGLAILTVLLPIVGPLLTFETRQPLFFTQVRVGRYGRPLRIIKLRTLRAPRDPYPSYWARKRGNNPSSIAALVRTIGIDELPQCWHVLTGQMSIVGPRPYVPEEVADYQKEIPFFRCRALVKPGLTGWAQVNWGYGLTLEDEIEKLQYDLYYVGHQSFYLDLLIILRTIALAARRARPLVVAGPVATISPVPVVPASLVALAAEDTTGGGDGGGAS